MSTCPACQERISPTARYCPWCGAGLGPASYPALANRRGTPGRDSRRHRRLPVRAPVTITTSGARHSGRMENLSTGGLFVATAARVAVDQQLDVYFSMPGQYGGSRARCQVRWVRGAGQATPGAGLRFVELNPVARAELQLYLDSAA